MRECRNCLIEPRGGWRRLLPPEQTVSEKRLVRDWCHLHPRLSSCEKQPWEDLWIYTSHGRKMIDHGPCESSNECSFMSGERDDNTDYPIMVTVNAHWVTPALIRAHVITSTFAGKLKIWTVHWLNIYHVAQLWCFRYEITSSFYPSVKYL